MASATTSGWRRACVAVLALALSLAGLGRAVASSSAPVGLRPALAGVRSPICHAGGAPTDPSLPPSHDCCDACALAAAALLPAPPGLVRPAEPRRLVRRAAPAARPAAMARPRGPRLSRGPPPA